MACQIIDCKARADWLITTTTTQSKTTGNELVIVGSGVCNAHADKLDGGAELQIRTDDGEEHDVTFRNYIAPYPREQTMGSALSEA